MSLPSDLLLWEIRWNLLIKIKLGSWSNDLRRERLSLVNGSSRKKKESHLQRVLSIKLELLLEGSHKEKELIILRFSH